MKKIYLIAACSAATLSASWAAAPFGEMTPMHYGPNDNRTIVVPKADKNAATERSHSISGSELSVTEPFHSITAAELAVTGPFHPITGSELAVTGPFHSITGSELAVTGPFHSMQEIERL
ncbi:MAG TPA: hypothetical protein VIH54_15655 [Chthoniobacterales bacterium]